MEEKIGRAPEKISSTELAEKARGIKSIAPG